MTVQFFYRTGEPVSGIEIDRVVVGARGESGQLIRMENCPRCSGRGGSTHWRPDSGICYQCRGKCFVNRAYRVYTAAKLETLDTAEAQRTQRKVNAATIKAAIARKEFITWAKPHGKIIGGILTAKGTGFLPDLASKLRQYWVLTDRQLGAAVKVLDAIDNRGQAAAKSEYVGEIKQRIEFEAVILGVYETEGRFGHTDVVKMRDMEDNMFTWFASGYQDLVRGDRVSVRGTVKKHNEYMGIKQTIITRCKIEKFEIVAVEDVGQVEDLV